LNDQFDDSDAPAVAKQNIDRAVEELRAQLRQKIIDVNNRVPIGNIANGDAPVARMNLVEKLGAAIQQAISSGKLAEVVVAQLTEMAKPENLAKAALFIQVYAMAHASPLAPALAVLDTYYLGTSGTDAGLAMWQIYLDLDSATTDADLTNASASLSELVSGPLAELLVKFVKIKAGRALGEYYKGHVSKGVADGADSPGSYRPTVDNGGSPSAQSLKNSDVGQAVPAGGGGAKRIGGLRAIGGEAPPL
jgi:hypothetical protein